MEGGAAREEGMWCEERIKEYSKETEYVNDEL